MPVLIVELHGTRCGAILPHRVLIGRRSMNHLIIDDAAVSRMHAWIDGEGDRFYLSDTGSRTGTRVNGQRIVTRHLLGDEDEITIGPAKLTFLAESRLRPGIEPLDLAPAPKIASTETGIPFDCSSCNAPLWASQKFAGVRGQCKYCGSNLTVPKPGPANTANADRRELGPKKRSAIRPRTPTVIPAPVMPALGAPGTRLAELEGRLESSPMHAPKEPAAATTVPATAPPAPPIPLKNHPAPLWGSRRLNKGEQYCGVCQSAISAFEEHSACPDCGLVFHAECWEENYGCSAYGCAQVNALSPAADHHNHHHNGTPIGESQQGGTHPEVVGVAHGKLAEDAHAIDRPARFPWEFLLLAGSVFSALAGALTFGLPSLALAGGTVAYMARNRGKGDAHRGVVLLSAGLGLLGVVAGVPVSWFLYFGGAHAYAPSH